MLKKLIYFWKQRNFWKLRKENPEEVFSDIYKNNVWGGRRGEFYSGSGSTNPNTDLYVDAVVAFITQHNIRTVVDLGCGDFRVMRRVLSRVNVNYTGVDVVKDLVDYNNGVFGDDHIRFVHCNVVDDKLPAGELVLIRQVLQHLSNGEIKKILDKLRSFRWALITEHLPIGPDVIPNIDKIHGPHIRMKANSGVFIDQPPFQLPVSGILLEYREDDPVKDYLVSAVIRTSVVSVAQP